MYDGDVHSRVYGALAALSKRRRVRLVKAVINVLDVVLGLTDSKLKTIKRTVVRRE